MFHIDDCTAVEFFFSRASVNDMCEPVYDTSIYTLNVHCFYYVYRFIYLLDTKVTPEGEGKGGGEEALIIPPWANNSTVSNFP